MYCISVDGITRYGKFEFDPERGNFSKLILKIDCDDGTTNGDVFSIIIKDDSGKEAASETWVVFKGNKIEVGKTIEDDMPMEKRELDILNKFFIESCECNDVFCTYVLKNRSSIGHKILSALHNVQQSLVANMYESEAAEVTVLNLN